MDAEAVDDDLRIVAMRDSASEFLSTSLLASEPRQALLQCLPESDPRKEKANALYDTFTDLLKRQASTVIEKWLQDNNYTGKLLSLTKFSAYNENSTEDPENNLTTAEHPAFFQPSAAMYNEAIASKKAELQRITTLIQQNETTAANMRVELNRQMEAAGSINHKVRSKAGLMERMFVEQRRND